MKNKIYTIFLLGLSLFLLSTCKNPKIGYETFTITDESIKPKTYNAMINGSFSFSGNVHEMKMKIATDELLTNATNYSIIIDNQTFSAEIDGLKPNTTYYYCYSIDFGWKEDYLTETNSFSTLKGLSIVTYCNPTDGGTATGGGTFTYGQSCTVTATAAAGYTFTNWTENDSVVSTNISYTFTVNTSRTLVANFTENPSTIYTITVSANPNNGGSVSGGGTFNQGASCTIHATANSGYTFVNWTENGTQVSTNANYTFTVTGNRSLVAHFQQQQQQYTISVSANPSNGGDVSGGGTFNYGQSCTVYASPTAGYTFTKWTENGSLVSTNANYTFTVTGNRSLVAHFQQQQQQYTISVSANPSNGGDVSGGGTFNYGQSCTVYASPTAGYTFTKWTENGSLASTNANYTFTVNVNRTLVANFAYNGGGNVPTGAINGVFSVSATQQVYFSQGNLQYNTQGSHQCIDGTTKDGIWRFATNQYDCIGYDNNNISIMYSGWIDLFGWGTSGYNQQPWSTSIETSYYNAYGDPYSNLYDHSGYADWGVYNTISNGSQNWRTLTQMEWDYILNEREASSLNGVPNARYAKAKVSGVAGLILFPDNYNHPDNIPISGINDPGTNYSVNEYNSSQWSQMEENGYVFLPAAGIRKSSNVSPNTVDELGYYWSSTRSNNSHVYVLHFDNNNLEDDAIEPYIGLCVRLVHPIQ